MSSPDSAPPPVRPESPTIPSTAVEESSSPPDPQEKPGKKPGRWRRRIKWTLIVLVALAILLRIALGFALPYVVNAAAKSVGMTAHYDDMSLSLTGGEATVWNLRVVPKDPKISGGEPVFAANYLRGDISPLALLKGRIVVWRAEADTVDLRIERRADGSLALMELMPPPASEPASDEEEPAALSFTAPLALDALRLNRVRARVIDAAVDPPIDTVVELNARISSVGPDAPQSQIEIDIFAPPMLDVLKVRALATAHERELDSSLTIDLFGLRPGALSGYLAQLGLIPAADQVNARMSGTLTTTAVEGDDRAVRMTLALKDIVGDVDGRPELGVRQVLVEAPYVGPEGVDAEQVLIEGVQLSALRTGEGAIRVLGIELPPAPPESAESTAVEQTAVAQGAPETTVSTQPAGEEMSFKLARFVLRDAAATVRDEAVSPAVDLLGEVLELSVSGLAWPPASADATVAFDASLAAPGVARSVRASGQVQPFADMQRLSADLAAEGILPSAIEPYLRAAGVESLLKDGRFAAHLEASLDASADGSPSVTVLATGINYADGAGDGAVPLVVMPEASLAGLALLGDGTLRVDEIILRGPALDVHLGADGAITAAGFRTIPVAPASALPEQAEAHAASPAAPVAVTNPSPAEPLVKAIDLGHLSWEGLALTLADAASEPAIVTTLGDVAVDVKDLRIDLVPPPAGADASRAGTVAVRVNAPELIDHFEASGTLAASAGTLDASIQFTGEGITLASLRPLLARSGIEPQWTAAGVTGTLAVRAVPEEGMALPRLDVDLQSLALTDAGTELAGLDRLVVSQFTSAPDGAIRVEGLEVARPRITGRKAADGSIVVAGVRLAPPPSAEPEAQPAAGAVQDAAAAPEAAAFPFGPLVLPPVALGSLKVTEATLTWADETRPEPIETALSADLELRRFDSIDSPDADTAFSVVLRASGLDALTLAGQLSLGPNEQRVVADVAADGVNGAALAAFLPPGIELAVGVGQLRLHAEARLRPGLAEGGLGAQLALTGLDWRDGPDGSALASMQGLEVQINRFDPAAGAIDVQRVSVQDLASGARLGADGSTSVAGIRLVPAATPAEEPKAAPMPAAAIADAGEPARETQDVQDGGAQDVLAGLGRARGNQLPRVTLEELDLHLARFEVVNESRPEAAPLVLENVRLTNPGPLVMDPADGEGAPPARLALSGAVEPVIGAFRVDLAAQPLARSPTANLSLRVEGIRGEGLIALMPELAETLDASELTDGRFALDLESRAQMQWRDGLPDLASGIGGELLVRDISFRNGVDGPVLLGLDELEADRIRFEPSSGGLVIGSLELRTPRGHAALDDRGLHAAGLVFLMEEADPASSGPAVATTRPAEPAPAVAEATPQAGQPTTVDPAALPPELRIDSLRVSGADFTFEDRTAEPPLVAPITNLDVDVRGLSNRLATQPGTLRFSIMANAGQVELPKPPEGSGIAGAIGDVGRLLGGDQDRDVASTEMEKRDLFAQFSTTGRLQLHPKPDGRVNVSLSGLEMLSLRGLAQSQGIVISNGVFDLDADLRLNPDNTIEVRSKSDFTSLRVSEPANGPIYQYLRLPAPLDTVIVTLQDAGGTISLPISITVEGGTVGTGDMLASVASALSQVIATAIVQSPMKAATGGLALLGIPQGARGFEKRTITLAFEPGSTQLDASSRRRLAAARALLRDNDQARAALRHHLGAEDLPLVSQRANPTPEEAAAVASRLRGQRTELLARRPELVGGARSAVAFGTPDEAEKASAALRSLDVRTAELDMAIESALELLSPGAARRADRRTRTTAISLGEQRLVAVQGLLSGGSRGLAARIQRTNPQFDPPDPSQSATQPTRAGGVVEIELVVPR